VSLNKEKIELFVSSSQDMKGRVRIRIGTIQRCKSDLHENDTGDTNDGKRDISEVKKSSINHHLKGY
jgi:hypothetical protein